MVCTVGTRSGGGSAASIIQGAATESATRLPQRGSIDHSTVATGVMWLCRVFWSVIGSWKCGVVHGPLQ